MIEGKGCVLGDDMGLGKTVQVSTLVFQGFVNIAFTNQCESSFR